ncbi:MULTISPECIES: imelysin family protein [unclassified Polaromonas]|uniref:imelysin family protein n=1 Tax=unclassified Polaromonas TaxID=2638319 RepID=UPI0018CA4C71|nr:MULTISPECIES: imelysin family protein [unclassified Polaromonas]MBG6071594.1 putative lipoprotein [Polaromonas sp. CG_9.7]MBG6113595.1 putative lipoprotein [Polaromonas sp. CG_9.2]MDH6184507.1 putative lipoprotein [Polaromonas sp. CG_23.6]
MKLLIQPVLALTLGLGLFASGSAMAQTNWSQVAVPAYSPTHVLQGLHQYWTLPRSDDFAREAQALPVAVMALCEAASPASQAQAVARGQWQATTHAWERLSAVAVGPLITRRSQRQIDFSPTRPALIERAIKSAPVGPQAMELVGTPGKGLPALEWLLWTRPVAPGSAACRYAVEVAHDIEREALALQQDFKTLAATDWQNAELATVAAGMSELVNQWAGGVERLRWAQMEKPLRAAGDKEAPEWPRASSGQTVQSWTAQWESLQALGVLQGKEAPALGRGLVPLETYLRGMGLNPVANALLAATQHSNQRIQKLAGSRAPGHPQVLDASRSLAALKRVTEGQVAPALDIGMGFSDADGD